MWQKMLESVSLLDHPTCITILKECAYLQTPAALIIGQTVHSLIESGYALCTYLRTIL